MQQVKFPTKINLNKGVCVCLKASDNNHAWIWVAKIVRTKETQRGDHDILHHIFFQCIWFPLKAAWNKNMKGPKNNSILKEIDPEYLLEGLTLKLKLQYFGHLMWRTDWLEKTLMLGKIEDKREEDDRGWDAWIASPTQWTWVWASSGSWWWTGKPGVLQSMGFQRIRHDWMTKLNWTELNLCLSVPRLMQRIWATQVSLKSTFKTRHQSHHMVGKASHYLGKRLR